MEDSLFILTNKSLEKVSHKIETKIHPFLNEGFSNLIDENLVKVEKDNCTSEIHSKDEQLIEDQDYIEESLSPSRATREAGIRWGLREDKLLFKTIHQLENLNLISLTELENIDPAEGKHNENIRYLHSILGWKSSFKDLVRRIQSKISHDFSKREIKYLKKIMNDVYNYENIDYEEVLYQFPGKTLERVKEASDMICEARRNRMLMNVNVNS